jgi:hypothetical protein
LVWVIIFAQHQLITNNTDNKAEKIFELLQYAPLGFIDKIISKLEEFKKIYDEL